MFFILGISLMEHCSYVEEQISISEGDDEYGSLSFFCWVHFLRIVMPLLRFFFKLKFLRLLMKVLIVHWWLLVLINNFGRHVDQWWVVHILMNVGWLWLGMLIDSIFSKMVFVHVETIGENNTPMAVLRSLDKRNHKSQKPLAFHVWD